MAQAKRAIEEKKAQLGILVSRLLVKSRLISHGEVKFQGLRKLISNSNKPSITHRLLMKRYMKLTLVFFMIEP